MAFYHEHSHGRAFQGLQPRHFMWHGDERDRPAHSDNKDRFIHRRPNDVALEFAQKAREGNVETVYTQVYVTETPTFPGAVTYSTVTSDRKASSVAAAEASYASAKSAANAVNTVNASSATQLKGTPLQHTSTQLKGTPLQHSSTPTTSSQITTTTALPFQHPHIASPTALKGTPISATQGSDSNLISQKSDGMSSGAKAGLGFGIILAIALCGGLIFFCWRRRKNQYNNDGAEKLNEKHASANSFFGGTAAAVGAAAGDARGSLQSEKSLRSSRTASTAPRLSLRPVTQFLPNIMETRKSTGNALDVPQMSEKPRGGWDRRPQNATDNPFDDAAVIDDKQARSVSPINPFDEGEGAVVGSKTTPTHSQKNSWEGSEPPTPKSTKFGTAAAVPITSAGAAGAQMRGPNNVHRVQLDFKPSMDDELELRSGQLVRMLHEYDDGWTLCMRMDRSQQGVCPRTCLSKLPVKPRPQGPPPQNGSPRPMGPPPPGMRRPASPAMHRPASPMHNNMMPRPLTPTGRERSNTGPRNSPFAPEARPRPRSQSVGGASARPMSPAGMPARKPVPGQAI